MGFIVDSSILITAARGRFSLSALAARVGDTPFAIAAITASELLHGVHRARDPQNAQRRLQFAEYALGLFPIIPFDLEIARIHAQLWAALEMQGLIIGPHDLQIAATARALNFGVVTTNEREFKQVPQLTVINPL